MAGAAFVKSLGSIFRANVDQAARAPGAAREAEPLVNQAPPPRPPGPEPVAVPEPDPPPVPDAPVAGGAPAQPLDTPPNVAAEASFLDSSDIRQFATTDIHQPNFDRLETTDDVKAVIAQMAELNADEIMESRRGIVADEQLRGMAADMGLQAEAVQQIMQRESGGTINAETILAARQVLHASGNVLKDLSGKVVRGEATEMDRLRLRRQLEFHREYTNQFMGARAETGRALRAFGIPTGDDTQTLARMTELTSQVYGNDIETIARAIDANDNIAGVTKTAREYTQSKVLGTVNELFINSILSGVKTQVVNASGNALFQTMTTAELHVAAVIGRFLNSQERVLLGEAQAQLWGQISGIKEGLLLFGQALRTGKSIDEVNKLELPYPKAISAQNYNLDESGPVGRAVDFMGTILRAPTERGLTAFDDMFKAIAYRGSLARQAYADAAAQAANGGVDNQQFADLVRQGMENASAEAMQKAEAEALYATFQNPLGPVGREFQGLVNKVPGLKVIIPFIRTPTNLFKAAFVERTPLGVFSQRIRDDIKAGGSRRDLALARMSMGTSITAVFAAKAASGQITGGGPTHPEARRLWLAAGNQPYSVKSVDPQGNVHWQSYQRAEPISFLIGSVADYVEAGQFADDEDLFDDPKAMSAPMAMVAAIAENTMSKTFLTGLSDAVKALDDPERFWKSWTDRLAGAMIPYSSLRRDLSRIQDPMIREAWTLNEKLRRDSGIPGMSEGLPPARDSFGDIRFHQSGTFLGVLSPFPDSIEYTDPVRREVGRVMQATNRVPISRPRRQIEGVKLDVHEFEQYIDLSRNRITIGAGGVQIEGSGANFEQALADLLQEPAYQAATEDARVDMIKDVQQTYDQAARGILIESNHALRTKIKSLKAHKLRKQVGEDNLPQSVRDLLPENIQ